MDGQDGHGRTARQVKSPPKNAEDVVVSKSVPTVSSTKKDNTLQEKTGNASAVVNGVVTKTGKKSSQQKKKRAGKTVEELRAPPKPALLKSEGASQCVNRMIEDDGIKDVIYTNSGPTAISTKKDNAQQEKAGNASAVVNGVVTNTGQKSKNHNKKRAGKTGCQGASHWVIRNIADDRVIDSSPGATAISRKKDNALQENIGNASAVVKNKQGAGNTGGGKSMKKMDEETNFSPAGNAVVMAAGEKSIKVKQDNDEQSNDINRREGKEMKGLPSPYPVLLRYMNPWQYQKIFAALVRIEADYDRESKDHKTMDIAKIEWHADLKTKVSAHFIYSREESGLKLTIGDELVLMRTESGWRCLGYVFSLNPKTGELILVLRVPSRTPGPWDRSITTGYVAEFVWKSTCYDRMQTAMREFAVGNTGVSGYLTHKVLGHDTQDQQKMEDQAEQIITSLPRQFSAPNLAQLNHSQIFAVTRALQSPLCLIQGPPGTGKTLTSATLVYHLSKMSGGAAAGSQVLVVAPSNVAVDQLAERIHRTGLKVVRVCAMSRESLPSSVDSLSLHQQTRNVNGWDELAKLMALKEECGVLSKKDWNRLTSLRTFVEGEVLNAADVICATCVGSASRSLRGRRFRQLLIDEATQATEPECLVPIVMGAQKLILVGDHCQLRPAVMCKRAANAGLAQSMFQRLVFLGIRPVRLEVQYRMHPALSVFPSSAFYDGCLKNGDATRECKWLESFWPNPEMPMFFYNSTGNEEKGKRGTSFLNRMEADNIEKLVTYLLNCGVRASQIGVVTPYDGQRALITRLLQSRYSEVEVASVDAFQGREKDIILLSCVRSNQESGIGFLHDPRRLNVAITRAKYGMVICGNAEVLSKSRRGVWCNLLKHYKKFDLIVEGPLSNLKPCTLPFLDEVPSRVRPKAPKSKKITCGASSNGFQAIETDDTCRG